MSKFKDWVMEMETDAEEMTLQEFITAHGSVNIDIWHEANDPEFERIND